MRRSIPHGCVARRLNSPAIRPPRALPCGRLDTSKCEFIFERTLSNVSFIAKSVARQNPQLLIKKHCTLITRSGSIGRMAYARADMDGMACTEDVLRVIPEADKVGSGSV